MIIPRGTVCQIVRAKTNGNIEDDNDDEIFHYVRMGALVRTAHDYDDTKFDIADIGILAHGRDFIGSHNNRLLPDDEYHQYTSFQDVKVISYLFPERAAVEPKMPSI